MPKLISSAPLYIWQIRIWLNVTPSTNELSDVFVHDAIIKLRHVASIAVERFMIVE